ncbi:unnamed protein product [Phaeothamnion confervicola]
MVVLRNLCKGQISDMSWGGDGATMAVSSMTGSVIWVRLDLKEFGLEIGPDQDRQEFFRTHYGLEEDPR